MPNLFRGLSAAAILAATALVSAQSTPMTTRSLTRVPAPIGPQGAAQELYSGSYALLVGVSRYDAPAAWSTLDSIPGELDQLEAALKAVGFERVERLVNPTGAELRRGVEDFIGRYGYVPGNRLLFFFSGHGFTLDKGTRGYFVPRDAPDPMREEAAFRRTALSMQQVATWAQDLVARHALFSFDSCFSGTIFRTRDRPIPQRITELTAKPVREFMSAGGAGEPVPARSVYTPLFIRGLRGDADIDQDGFVTGTELGNYVQREVIAYKTRQTPQFGKIRDPELDEGDIVFAVPAAPVAPLAAPPASVVRPPTPTSPPPAPTTTSRRGILVPVPGSTSNDYSISVAAGGLVDRIARGEERPRTLNASWARRDFFRSSSRRTYVAYGLQIDPAGQPLNGLAVYIRAVRTSAGGSPSTARPPEWFNAFPSATGSGPMELRGALGLDPGTYDFYTVIRETSGVNPRTGALVDRVDVPAFEGSALTTSSLVLAERFDTLAASAPDSEIQAHPYTFGTLRLYVSPDRVFRQSDELTALMHLYNMRTDASGKANLKVDYEFYAAGQGRETFFNRTSPLQHNVAPSKDGVISTGQTVPLKPFGPGEYRIDVVVTDQISGEKLTRSARFVVDGGSGTTAPPPLNLPPNLIEDQRKCDGGSAVECTRLGYALEKGEGVAVDVVNARLYYERGCNGNNALGCRNLALLYDNAVGVPRDYARAQELYQRACDGGDGGGCTNLGYMYAQGHGVAVDHNRARALYERGCNAKHGLGCRNLGLMYEYGPAVPKDLARALALYHSACEASDGGGCVNAGVVYEEGRGVAADLARARTLYERGCDLGSAPSCRRAGWVYDKGLGTTANVARAVALYQRACDGGDPLGCNNLGVQYQTGSGVAADPSRAAALYERACDGDIALGCRNLGSLYERGLGVTKDVTRAIALFRRGCDLKDTPSCESAKRLGG